MALTYFPCAYTDPLSSIPCGQFFPEDATKSHFCPAHRTTPEVTENKELYIDVRNGEMKYCHQMTLDELEVHIAGIETQIAELKAKYFAARGVRGDKLDKMTEEERVERRKWRSSAPVDPIKPKKSKDPVTHLGSKLGLNRSDAKDLMNMDVDALLAKFAESKAKKQLEG